MKSKLLTGLALVAATAALLTIAAGCGSTPASSASDMSATTTNPGGPNGGPGDMASVFATALDALVEKGTITAGQEEAIVAALANNRPAAPQGGAPVAGSPASPPAQPGEASGTRPDPSSMLSSAIDELVTAGTITSAQAETVLAAVSDAMPQPGNAPGSAPTTTPSAAAEAT